MTWGDLALALLALPFLALGAYLAGLALLARRAAAPPAASDVRFDVVVPAHDEEAGVAETVRSLLAMDYPKDRFRVVVVADNCSDHTAAQARSAGASVLERNDPLRRGKGHALAFAFERLGAEGRADAFVVVDADSVASANLLGALATRVRLGAEALQARYRVRNRDASWRTRLLHLGFTLLHDVRASARERLRVSCGLRGNGMAFSAGLLRRVPHTAFSIVEDLEYGLELGLAGVRVHDVAEAFVAGDMAVSEAASRTQRSRWEAGRLALARRFGPQLVARALRERSPLLLDLALDLLVPPLSTIAVAIALGLSLSVLGIAGGMGTLVASALWATAALCLGMYLARGWLDSGLGARGLLDLLYAPWFVLWRLWLGSRAGAAGRGEWQRTPREPRAR